MGSARPTRLAGRLPCRRGGGFPRARASSAERLDAVPVAADATGPAPPREFLRVARVDAAVELQAATAVFVPPVRGASGSTEAVALAATVHVADAAYYAALAERAESYDLCLYELIADERDVVTDAGGGRRLAVEYAPTPATRALALSHGLVAQLDALPLTRESWRLADLSRQELARLRDAQGEAEPAARPAVLEALDVALAGRARVGAGRQVVRLACWMLPCPELQLLLLDWVWAGGRPAPVLGPLIDVLARLDVLSARRLAFAQVLVSSQAESAAGGSSTSLPVLIKRRNAAAMDTLRRALDEEGCKKVAMLYGGLHMPDLACRVQETGLVLSEVQWQPVWRVEVPREDSPLRLAAFPLLLLLDAADWVGTLLGSVDGLTGDPSGGGLSEVLGLVTLYLLRHAVLYYQLSKTVLEWNRALFPQAEQRTS